MKMLKRLSIAFLLVGIAQTSTAQLYTAGDIVDNFTLTNRATGQPVTLHDFEGKIVFFEWFAHWCPFCKAAAAQVGPEIVDFYGNSNSHGVPFMHVAVNMQGDQETDTQNFIDTYGLEYVAEDFGRDISRKFVVIGQPIFAIINGVENSSSHEQWELVYSKSGYTNTNHPIDEFRDAIDSVLPPAPTIEQQPVSTTAASSSSVTLSITAKSADSISYQWYRNNEIIPNETNNSIELTLGTSATTESYHAVASNTSGDTTSNTAIITIIQILADYLNEQGVPPALSDPKQDADNDGASNLLEYISKTNATDPKSRPVFKATLQTVEGSTYLELEVALSTSILEYTTAIEFSDNIYFSTTSSGSTIHQQDNGQGSEVFLTRSSTSIGAGTLFARLAITQIQ